MPVGNANGDLVRSKRKGNSVLMDGHLIRLRVARCRRNWILRLGMLCLGWCVVGCDSLNPAFVNLLDPTGSSGLTSLDNAPGHVVITFINNAEVDERLLAHLESAEGGNLVLTDAEKRALRPRLRLRVRVEFTDNSFLVIEFIDGSVTLVDQSFAAESRPELNQNDLNNIVVLCDVQRVSLETGSEIQVFMPVELTAFELVETTNAGGGLIGRTFEARERIPPGFRTLRVDDLDENNNVELRRNIDVRDFPSDVNNPICGSVIAFAVRGTLSVPFLAGESDLPSYDRDDATTEATIGGRFEFVVSVQ